MNPRATSPRRPRSAVRLLWMAAWLCAAVLFAGGPSARAEDPMSPEEVRKRSLPLRTALHHDPTLGSPLDRLLDLYRKSNRVEELIALYRSHLQGYPNDLSARIVYTRLLLATSDPEGPREVRSAVERHPKNGFLQHLLFSLLDDAGDGRALDALDKAVQLETLPTRKRRWIEQLLTQALQEDRRDLAAKHLGSLAELMGGGAEAHLGAARKMQEFGFHERALKQLATAQRAQPSPENGVEIELLASSLEVALNRRAKAAARLDALLGRLTADYWRRSEILRRRARLVASAAERDRMLSAARQRSEDRPQDESAALDLSRLLSGFERHREALTVLLDAGKRLPGSARLEKEALAIYDRLRDERGRAQYLEKRIAAFPDREDLAERRVRSLFLLGRKQKAMAMFDSLLVGQAEGVRVQRLLEMARFLRAHGLPTTAADLYARVVELRPARLDVRREWAECHLAVGDRRGARQVLAAPLPPETPKDVFLDLMQLLMQQWLYPEARKALRERVKVQDDDLDIYLALIEVEGSLGYGTSAARWVDKARPLADTPARYRRWLEQSVDFHQYYDSDVAFLDAEQSRIEGEVGAWTAKRLGRVEVFAEISANSDRVEPVAGLLQNYLSVDVSAEVRVRLRRKLAALLEEAGRGWFVRNEGHLGAAANELKGLLEEDPEYAHEYRARLALIHVARERLDLARPLLEKIDVRRLGEAPMLERLASTYTDLDNGAKVLECLERLTVLAASDRGHWEDWITALTATGEEHKLRSAIRRLLRGVPRLTLSRDSKDELTDHLRDSYWRSVGRHMALRTEAGYLDALALLDEVERLSAAEDMPLWVSWTRAFVFNALGRTDARDEAIGELDRLMEKRRKQVLAEAARLRKAEVDEDGNEEIDLETEAAIEEQERLLDRIEFPDGLGASWKSARALLTRTDVRETEQGRPVDRRGPEGRLAVRWVFDTDGEAAVTAVLPLTEDRLLIADAKGDLYGVERTSGKVVWNLAAAFQPQAATNAQWRAYAPVQTPIVGPGGTFFVPDSGRILCFGADGTKRWEAEHGTGSAALKIAAAPEALFVYAPDSGEVAALHPADGRLRWHRTLDMKSQSPPLGQGAGISLEAGRLLVYGPRTAILSAADGAVQWTFEPDRVRRVPLTLEEPDERVRSLFGRRSRRSRKTASAATAAAGTSPGAVPFGAPPPPVFFSGRRAWPGAIAPGWGPVSTIMGPGGQPIFLTNPGRSPQTWSPKQPTKATAVVAPAVRWASPLANGASRRGLLFGRRLLLMRTNAGTGATGGEALVTDLDLPLFGKQVKISGTPIGRVGQRLALLQNGSLLLWNVERGTQGTFDLAMLGGDRKRFQVHAARDGAFLYLTGPTGVLCVNLLTLRQVFHTPWPESARLLRNDDPNWVQYLLHGMTEFRQGSAMTPVVKPCGFADDRTLYAVSDAYRVVALQNAGPGGPGPDKPAKKGDAARDR